MQSTKNYQLVKQELTDRADITQISGNWDKIDTEMKRLSDDKFDKAGGTITGKTTISKGGLDVAGGVKTGSLTVTGETDVGTLVTESIRSKVNASKGTKPRAAQSVIWQIFDKDGTNTATDRLGYISYRLGTDNVASMNFAVANPLKPTAEEVAGVISQWLADGSARISVTHHPTSDSNDKNVATTYWVRNLKATASQYGLVKVADETALLSESDEAALTVDKAYELNDFRRMNTAYKVGDRVSCAFRYEFFLECTTAGTTAKTTLDTRNINHGQVITDGTCKWTVRSHPKSVNGVVPDANGNIDIGLENYDYKKWGLGTGLNDSPSGSSAEIFNSQNFDDWNKSGFFTVSATNGQNTPTGSAYFTGIMLNLIRRGESGTSGLQIMPVGSTVYYRSKSNAAWNPWYAFARDDLVVHTSDNPIVYKKLPSIKSVKGSFWFDSSSGIDRSELHADMASSDWYGIQYGMLNGNDKIQFIFNSNNVYWRYSNQNLGSEMWTADSWTKFCLANLVFTTADNVFTGTNTFVDDDIVSDGSNIKFTSKDSLNQIFKVAQVKKGTLPTNRQEILIRVIDATGSSVIANTLAELGLGYTLAGDSYARLLVSKTEAGATERSMIDISYDLSAKRFVAQSPTPPSTGAGRSEIATVGFVKDRIAEGSVATLKATRTSAGSFTVSGLKVGQPILLSCYLRNNTYDGGDYSEISSSNVSGGSFQYITGALNGRTYTAIAIADATSVTFNVVNQGITSATWKVYAL